MSIAIKDIPDETWNKLREDYQDELATMTSIEEDELNSMLFVSARQQDKLNKENDIKPMPCKSKEDIEIAQIILSSDEHLNILLSLWWSEGNTLRNAEDLNDFKKFCYGKDVNALEALYHFETQGWDNNLRCIIFTRTVERGQIHEVILEDHRDDEPTNDWLIFSYLKDSITDFGGMPEDEQYPLELGEYKLFARLIGSIEQLYPLENS